jgi:hypothetical protein
MTNKTFSPYACAKIVNIWLAEDGIPKKLPPQMFYTYVKKAYIKSVSDEKGKILVTDEALKTWYDKYTKKAELAKVEKATAELDVDPAQISLFDIESDES